MVMSRENPKTFPSLEVIMKRRKYNTLIPIDILFTEILPKLPVKSLFRFKIVSKSFNSLISSPAFTRLHSLSTDNRILMVSNTMDKTLYSYDLNSLSYLHSHPSSTFRWAKSDHIINSYNGFLLVGKYIQFPLVLLNPSNRTYIDIPPYPSNTYIDTGLGFDNLSVSYKVVLLSKDDSYNRVTSVYNVNSKSWKVVDQTSHRYLIYGRGVLTNQNLIHWRCMSDANIPRRIICFDVCTETWKNDVLLPSHYYDQTFRIRFNKFGVLDGWLFSTFNNKPDSSIHIWVMKEYGVQESWIKLLAVSYRIFNPYQGVVPVAYRGGGSSEVLLREPHQSRYVWYNLKNNTMKEALFDDYLYQLPCICNESLESLPDAKLFGAFYESDEIAGEQL